MRADLFDKLMTNKDFSEDEKSPCSHKIWSIWGYYLEKYAICWSFAALLTAIYIISQNLLLGSMVFFTYFTSYSSVLMKAKHTGDDMAQRSS